MHRLVKVEVRLRMLCFVCDILVAHWNSYSYARRGEQSSILLRLACLLRQASILRSGSSYNFTRCQARLSFPLTSTLSFRRRSRKGNWIGAEDDACNSCESAGGDSFCVRHGRDFSACGIGDSCSSASDPNASDMWASPSPRSNPSIVGHTDLTLDQISIALATATYCQLGADKSVVAAGLPSRSYRFLMTCCLKSCRAPYWVSEGLSGERPRTATGSIADFFRHILALKVRARPH